MNSGCISSESSNGNSPIRPKRNSKRAFTTREPALQLCNTRGFHDLITSELPVILERSKKNSSPCGLETELFMLQNFDATFTTK
jgi:hypothetical protein